MTPETKFVFFGTPEFAAIILEKLISARMPPAAVVCNPDRPVGRKKLITPPPAKICVSHHASGVKNEVKILQPEKLDENFKLQIASSKADFAVVAAYAKIIPKEVLNLFPKGVIGVHPSLLPKYRGSSPIQTAILNGEIETGVTLFLLDEKVDHGPVLAQRELEFPISNSQFPILLQKLAELAGDLLLKTLPKFASGEIKPKLQDESQATYTRKFITEDGFIDPNSLEKAQNGDDSAAVEIDRKIRALNPEPSTWTMQNDKRVKLLEATLENGKLKLRKIQIEGEKPKLVN